MLQSGLTEITGTVLPMADDRVELMKRGLLDEEPEAERVVSVKARVAAVGGDEWGGLPRLLRREKR